MVSSIGEPLASSYQLITTLGAHDAQGASRTSWIDTSVSVGGQTLYRLYYKIAAVDSTDKESVRATAWIYNAPPPVSSGKQSAIITSSGQNIVLNISPNPFDTDLLFCLDLPMRQYILLQLFDILGRQIGIVFNGVMEAGHHDISFHTGTLSGSTCFYRLQSDTRIQAGLLLQQR